MKYQLYSIRDNLVAFDFPRVSVNEQAAIRDFAYGINNPDSPASFRPGDYDLYRIGYFDSDKGVIVPEDVPVLVVTGSSVFGDVK